MQLNRENLTCKANSAKNNSSETTVTDLCRRKSDESREGREAHHIQVSMNAAVSDFEENDQREVNAI
eukprot:752061-Hanusia_phi.AAC.4